ncbi:related to Aquaporin 3 [Ustilago trichophora]|uniref:Related to Aquaporin 3 n=1 Tax=Ustilago trichophora TaxID=86804 RepID=A0A5C3E3J8_9BASI|nr:related to Aquaporin 3 [Ustilago trichophora]
MTRLSTVSQLSARDVHPNPTTIAPLLPASAPLPHQQTPLHKPPRWWPSPSSSSSAISLSYPQGGEPNTWAKLRHIYREEIAEFFGTFLILIFGAGVECQVNLHYHSSATRDSSAYGSYLQGRLAWAAGVAMAGWVSGGISGGHCNPSVTIALACFRGFPRRKILPFIMAQILGATMGSLLVYANNVAHIERFEGNTGHRSVTGPTSTAGFFFTFPSPDLSFSSAVFSEFLATSILLFVVFALADTANLNPPKGTQPFAMFIVLLGIGASLGYNTGYAINGARDTGPRIALWLMGYGKEVWTHDGWYWLWNPWLASIAGGVVGAGTYDVFVYSGVDSPVNKPKQKRGRVDGYGALTQDEEENGVREEV